MGEFNLPGVRFWPTDEEVVKCYLRKKAMGEPLPGSFMIERDLYGEKSPWEILMINSNIDDQLPWQTSKSRDKNDRIKTDAAIYVVTPLKKAGRRGCDTNRRNGRSAGCGAWHGENGQEIIDVAGGHVIGFKKMFIFEVQNESVAREIEMGSMIQHHWIMHEYTLNDDRCPFAICKLMVDDFKKVKIAPKSRIRKKNSGVHIQEEVAAAAMGTTQLAAAAVAKEVVMVSDSDKIYDHEYYSRRSKRIRDEEEVEKNSNHSQKRKQMPLLSEEAVLPIDHPVVIVPPPVQQSPSITATSGGDHNGPLLRMPPLLQLVVEEKRFQEETITVQQQPTTTTTTTTNCNPHHTNTDFVKPQNQRVHNTNGDGNEIGNGSLVQTTIEPLDFLFDDNFGIAEYFDHGFDIDLCLDLDKLEELTDENHLQELEEAGAMPLYHCHHHQRSSSSYT